LSIHPTCRLHRLPLHVSFAFYHSPSLTILISVIPAMNKHRNSKNKLSGNVSDWVTCNLRQYSRFTAADVLAVTREGFPNKFAPQSLN
jgi:hypothetical protein